MLQYKSRNSSAWYISCISTDRHVSCFLTFPVQFSVLHLCFLFHLGPSPCRCGRLWADPSGAPGCRRVTPTSSGSGWRSGCSVTLSTRRRWDGSWRTSCGCWGGSACRFTSWETSSACRGAADRSKAHSQVYRSRCSKHDDVSIVTGINIVIFHYEVISVTVLKEQFTQTVNPLLLLMI